ncbi:DUF421 domain-containing protein [Virgibacillus halophilus]|uniref:DUF421 domain-containing protein n=1 Tax=Tigheibacillus halophilus TaxID=361280 RepID=A0ABU5CBD4_9BACI|nr:DUF421 domain-containing protein [Virgibacillus halophilus]
MEIFLKYIFTPIAVFLVGYILLRFMGKRAVAQMTSFDLLVVFIIGTTVTGPLLSKKLGLTTYYVLAIALIYVAFSLLSIQNKFKKILISSPTVLVRDGNIDENGLHQARISVEGLTGLLRQKGYTNIGDLSSVIMEETGHISAIPKSEKRAVQPADLQLMPSPAYIPIPLIIDGEIIDHNLKYVNKDRSWLTSQLQGNQLAMSDLSSVTLATLNQQGFLEIDTNKDKRRHQGIHQYKPGNQN